MKKTAVALFSALSIFLSPLAANDTAAEKSESDGFRPLFNGKDLSGWTPVNTAPSTWSVRDGMLICSGKPIGELRTTRMYQNFIMELEWRHMKPRGNAGIFVWADDITARGQPFHRSIEVQVLENAYGNTRGYTTHGDIFPIHGAKMTPINGRGGSRAFPTENRSKPSPEWNHYRITCVDGEISLAVNGKVVTRGKDCSPRKGYICIESEGGIVHYRNMRIKELPGKPVPKEHVAIAARGYGCLYTGVDFSGWKIPEAGGALWKSKDWVFGYTGGADSEGRAIETERTFSDFGFILDVRLNAKSAPAVLQLRGSEKLSVRIDPSSEELGLVKKGRGWNRLEGTVKGDRFSLSVNGREIFRDRKIEGAPAKGPIRIVPTGKIDFANPYWRSLVPKSSLRRL